MRRLAIALLLVCPLLLSSSALADSPDVSLSGTLERTHVDTANGPRPIDVLSTATGPRVVRFPAGHPVPPDGAQVRLRGQLTGTTLDETAATVTEPSLALPASETTSSDASTGTPLQDAPLAAGVARTVAIVVITFSTGIAPSYTDTQLRGVLTQNANSVSNYFAEQSYGQVSFKGIADPTGDIYRVSITANGTGCSSNWPTWGSQAYAAAGGNAVLGAYNHVIYVFNSQNTCGWAGLGYMPGSVVYIDNYFQLSVVAHELGHNLGVHHASSLRCIVNGQAVAFANANGACTSGEYGDPYDIMGSSNTNQQNAFHKYQSGWLSGPRVQTITHTGDYTVNPLELSSGVALLLIAGVTSGTDTNNSPTTNLGQDFALDLRQPYGTQFDAFPSSSPAVGGIEIHLVQTPGTGSPVQTQLIDTTPQTSSFLDAALTQGNTFTDFTDGITITNNGITPLVGATVHVTLGASASTPDTTPPSAVGDLAATVSAGPVVTLAFAPATDTGGISSYRVTRDGGQIASLPASTTSYQDWTASPGVHTYTVTAVDISGNVGATTTVVATVPTPAVPATPPVNTTTPTPPTTPTTTGPTTRLPKTTKPKVKNAPHVKAKVISAKGKTRRVLVTWQRVAGSRHYVVLRNGRRLASTTAHTLVDPSAPRGALHYVVRAS
jgi:hypothetical protein